MYIIEVQLYTKNEARYLLKLPLSEFFVNSLREQSRQHKEYVLGFTYNTLMDIIKDLRKTNESILSEGDKQFFHWLKNLKYKYKELILFSSVIMLITLVQINEVHN